MELKEFITTTLVEIHDGVNQAIQTLRDKELRGAINPISSEDGEMTPSSIKNNKSNVDFDIAVTTTSSDTAGAKAGIQVMGINVGANGSNSSTDSSVTRIKFSIPCIPPATLINPVTGRPHR